MGELRINSNIIDTVNLVKLATGRRLRGALVATNPLTEVTCNDKEYKSRVLSVASFTKLTVLGLCLTSQVILVSLINILLNLKLAKN